jgi:hypothetical protein
VSVTVTLIFPVPPVCANSPPTRAKADSTATDKNFINRFLVIFLFDLINWIFSKALLALVQRFTIKMKLKILVFGFLLVNLGFYGNKDIPSDYQTQAIRACLSAEKPRVDRACASGGSYCRSRSSSSVHG